jgi:hypothetical protein
VEAVTEGNDARTIDCMPDEALAYFGGRDRVLDALVRVKAAMADKGIAFVGADVGTPNGFTQAGDQLFGIVPQSVTMRGPGGGVRTHGFLLAVSRDGGTTWKFVNGGRLTPEKLAKMFPTLPEGFALPPASEPERTP